MATLVLVPFDGGPAAQAALNAACLDARRDGGMVVALYVVLVPRQLPLTPDLPWLAREVTRVRLLAEPILRQAGANAWADWVCARELAPAVADVAAELHARRIVLGAHARRRPAWLCRWSLPERLRRIAPCPVVTHDWSETAAPEVAQPVGAAS